MKSAPRTSKRNAWNVSSDPQAGKTGRSQKPPAYGVTLADNGPQAIQAFRGFPNQQKGPGFRESKDKSFHPDSQYQLRPADDTYEQQADRLAEKIMAGQPVGERVKKLNPPVSATKTKKGGQEGEEVNTETAQEIENAQGKGRPLPEAIRRPAEKALGKDLSRVRLHTGAQAEQINQSINAEAAAVNQDIFATKRAVKNPAILLHETVHTAQQPGTRSVSDSGNIQRFSIKDAYKRFTKWASKLGSNIHQPAARPANEAPIGNPIYDRVPANPYGRVSVRPINYGGLPPDPQYDQVPPYGQLPASAPHGTLPPATPQYDQVPPYGQLPRRRAHGSLPPTAQYAAFL